MKRQILTFVTMCIIVLASFQVSSTIAVNEEELFEQDIENYLPPYMLLDITVNVTTSSVLSGVNLIGDDLQEKGWAVANVNLKASEGLATITPIRYIDSPENGLKTESLETFKVSAKYPSPLLHEVISIDQTAVQSEVAEIGYEDRYTDALTTREVLDSYDFVKSQIELDFRTEDFAADELKPDSNKIEYKSEAADTDRLAFHIFTATKDLNETAYIWTADALGLDNITAISEMNVSTAEIEHIFPYNFKDKITSGITDGIYKLNLRKALTSVKDSAYNAFDSIRGEQSSTNSKKPKNIIFNIGPFALSGDSLLPKPILINNGFEVPYSTYIIIIVSAVALVLAIVGIWYFTQKRPRKQEEAFVREANRQSYLKSRGLR